MNNLIQKLRDKRDKCKECGGIGEWKHIDDPKCPDDENILEDCKTCNGTGVHRDLEFGCQLKVGKNKTKRFYLEDVKNYSSKKIRALYKPSKKSDFRIRNNFQENIKNLGKPLTLADVLVMLDSRYFIQLGEDDNALFEEGGIVIFEINLKTPIEEQKEVIKSLSEILL